MTRRGKNVVFIDETSWLNCRYDYNVAWMSNFHVLIDVVKTLGWVVDVISTLCQRHIYLRRYHVDDQTW